MTEILLIHGSCHGAWCWSEVLAELETMGQPARAIDLPGHGDDPTPRAEVTLDAYADAILQAIERPTIVVGHSMGGFPVTAAALKAPELVARLVYLTAYVPRDGASIADMRHDWPEQPLLPVIRHSEDRTTLLFDDASLEPLFYHDCTPEQIARARKHLTPQPVLPQRVGLSPATPEVPRHYIVCDDDRAILPGFQEQMAKGIADVQHMPTSHSPFFAAPRDLARRLTALAAL
ncbi:Pyrethroid hydrolase [Rhodobacteraceae bacterium THAF1]|uniref:alpha/beta fold hydrolase n=1 Tax=Palleronia sp. THAF1 TaxID=2587842 RepID=UPI000F3CF913|nr:alpha/beta fold hydrolase [Palleronia sp. THAF1]QFU09489.1 Pyrethroid hydrolase [Palleronia sp. THAF1]VDC21832.1 Pyrethroid hydrolase [Rhodobacteraceae bacterium THAF1]